MELEKRITSLFKKNTKIHFLISIYNCTPISIGDSRKKILFKIKIKKLFPIFKFLLTKNILPLAEAYINNGISIEGSLFEALKIKNYINKRMFNLKHLLFTIKI